MVAANWRLQVFQKVLLVPDINLFLSAICFKLIIFIQAFYTSHFYVRYNAYFFRSVQYAYYFVHIVTMLCVN